MIYTFKSIRLLCVCYLVFISFFSTLYAGENEEELVPYYLLLKEYPEDWSTYKASHKDLFPLSLQRTPSISKIYRRYYRELKKNNFEDFTTKDRIIFLYLHSIWEKLLESNNLSYLNDLLLWNITNDESSNGHNIALFNNIINLVINELFPSYINDAYIAARLSHELAHTILKHHESTEKLLEELSEEYEAEPPMDIGSNEIDEEFFKQIERYAKEWSKYIHSHPDYINLKRKHEIEADNLGFELYLNAGFKAQYYADRFIYIPKWDEQTDPYAYLPLSSERKKILVSSTYEISLLQSILGEGIRTYTDAHQLLVKPLRDWLNSDSPEEKERISQFMERIKYYGMQTDEHPTFLWRFWNLLNQEEEKRSQNNEQVVNNKILNTAYFRIDVSHLERLDEIREFFSNRKNFRSTPAYTDLQDIRVYIIQELLKDDSKISFTLELDPTDQQDVAKLKDDNTILLRANDIFRISVLFLRQNITRRVVKNPCADLFKDKSTNMLNPSIKEAFI